MDPEWKGYEDLIEEGDIPMFGIRIVTYMNTQGQLGYKWYRTGDHTLENLVMMLERVKFLVQFRSDFEDLVHQKIITLDEDDS